MPTTAPRFRLFGVAIFLPNNSIVGLALVAWFAIPTVQEILPEGNDFVILLVALLHAVALYISILVHELGHAKTALRLGYQVEGVTLTIIGGHTTVHTHYQRARDQAAIAAAGPFATILVGLAGWATAAVTSGLIHSVASWLAWSSFIIGAVNLLPGVPLDGGSILDALVWRLSRRRKLGRQVSALSGLLVAALWAVSPWLVSWYFERDVQTSDVIISGVVGLWMASTAWRVFLWASRADATVESLSATVPSDEPIVSSESASQSVEPTPPLSIDIRSLVRRAVSVDSTVTVATALEIAREQGAGAIVVISNSRVVGIVRESAVALMSSEARSLKSVSAVARRIDVDDQIAIDAVLADVAVQLSNVAAEEWLVVDANAAIVGVLFRSDIPRSF